MPGGKSLYVVFPYFTSAFPKIKYPDFYYFFLANTLDIWEARRYNGPESSEGELFGEAAAG